VRLRYAISPKSQIIYVHGRDPKMLYVEYESNYPYIWIECDTEAHHYPRAFDVHDRNDDYLGDGILILPINEGIWNIYDCGPSTTAEFDRVRWPNKAPMPLREETK